MRSAQYFVLILSKIFSSVNNQVVTGSISQAENLYGSEVPKVTFKELSSNFDLNPMQEKKTNYTSSMPEISNAIPIVYNIKSNSEREMLDKNAKLKGINHQSSLLEVSNAIPIIYNVKNKNEREMHNENINFKI